MRSREARVCQARELLPVRESRRRAENRIEHGRRELARIRVLTAGMVRRDDDRAAWRFVPQTMAEQGLRTNHDATFAEQTPRGLEADSPERHDYANAGQRRHLRNKMRMARR